MAISEFKQREYVRKLLLSRMRVLCDNGFYGLLLMNMNFGLNDSIETAATDGEKIIFAPQFLEQLSESELDFVLMHEVLHTALRHVARKEDRDIFLFNIACDIVVNSNIMLSNGRDVKSITLKNFGEAMHVAPNGKEGYNYTAEEVYAMLLKKEGSKKSKKGLGVGGKQEKDKENWDDHSLWKDLNDEEDVLADFWTKKILDAEQAMEIRNSSGSHGNVPMLVLRLIKELKTPQTDWRTVLADFVQEELVDYSFSPPDRRFDETSFYLPDFNETAYRVDDVLFMIDTSASMSDETVTMVYSEVRGALEQFDGKLTGSLGFFDAKVVEPIPFTDEEEFKVIRPYGGGGTSFQIIFDYVKDKMIGNLPSSIVILTDGGAPFPNEKSSMGIPVLWIVTNEKITPPWGKVAYVKNVKKNKKSK